MQTLDKSLRDTEVSQRKKFLIMNLRKLGVFETTDGRSLDDVSLYTLEWNYVTAKNDAIRAYGEE
ncbi:hypothetical protein [Oceanobacillus alkalisoli]|uniref:hypothetical protein n=1 Tax=Oceanobacillus alkalisoli TaxID=2925113 RepID=UPI001EE41953|nr:hypothetical protein [Oceanobacillus alkalisoli]MCG5104430.1 hypothetical protein [Oceanobacillus alkalisoli]